MTWGGHDLIDLSQPRWGCHQSLSGGTGETRELKSEKYYSPKTPLPQQPHAHHTPNRSLQRITRPQRILPTCTSPAPHPPAAKR